MPYADKKKQLEYQRKWMKARREQWLKENGPCVDCGSWENLQVDHDDPEDKVTHRIWSYSKEERDLELEKCEVRCKRCHCIKTRNNDDQGNVTLTVVIVRKIWEMKRKTGYGKTRIARKLKISESATGEVLRKKTWKDLIPDWAK